MLLAAAWDINAKYPPFHSLRQRCSRHRAVHEIGRRIQGERVGGGGLAVAGRELR